MQRGSRRCGCRGQGGNGLRCGVRIGLDNFVTKYFGVGRTGLGWSARSSLGVWIELTSCEIAKLAIRQIRIA